MHAILEGVLPYEIKLFLIWIIQENMMTLYELNNRFHFNFNWGKIDVKDNPSPVALDKKGALIGLRAAQSWCLGRFLPLIISDIINSKIKNAEKK